jgi:hypothetical protein
MADVSMRLMRSGHTADRPALGERALHAQLDGLSRIGVMSLHDRLRPGGKGLIDHVAVTATGVWVIEAQSAPGEVVSSDIGGWLSADLRLRVGGRDRMKLVTSMSKQVLAVRKALGPAWGGVPVWPMLCFVDAQWRWYARPFELRGVLVTWPRPACELLAQTGPYSEGSVAAMAAALHSGLPPAR